MKITKLPVNGWAQNGARGAPLDNLINYSGFVPSYVPEPSSAIVLGLASLGILIRRRRRFAHCGCWTNPFGQRKGIRNVPDTIYPSR